MKSMIAVVLASFALSACARPVEQDMDQPSAEAVSAKAPSAGDAVEGTAAPSPADAKAKLALAQVAELLGAGKPAEAYELAEAFDVRFLDHDTVRSYDGRASLRAIAPEPLDRMYPVLDGGKVVASLTMHDVNGEWTIYSIGVGEASAKLIDLRRSLRGTRAVDGNAVTIVHGNGTATSFLYHREHEVEYLTSFTPGTEPRPEIAQTALGRVAERAREAAQQQPAQ